MLAKSIKFSKNFLSYPYKNEVARGIMRNWFPIFLKYPVNQKPRYGYFKPKLQYIDAIFAAQLGEYKELFDRFSAYSDPIKNISVEKKNDVAPYWDQPWFTSLDAIVLYCQLAETNPAQYIEIGSGNSTKFVKQAIRDFNLRTKITSIDPYPRAEIDDLSDTVIRKGLEDCDLDLFKALEPNDLVFFDGSHRCFMNSDVTVFFLEILPLLPKDANIHIHDIHLPYDYPPERVFAWESEQYPLATMLMTNQSNYVTTCPNNYLCNNEEMKQYIVKAMDLPVQLSELAGSSYWMRKLC